MTTYLCDHAILAGGQVHERVAITVTDGRIDAIRARSEPEPTWHRLRGLTLPGFANAHSHAFHRALRSRTQADRGSFWTWRDLMYGTAERLDPDNYFRLARATFAEMALAGIVAVGEFHYVHHQAGGAPYDEPNAMGHALLAAAAEVGIRITLLDTLYVHGGLTAGGYGPPTGVQLRYRDASADAWAERVDGLVAGPGQRIGAAIHSVRAVDPHAIAVAAAWADTHGAPLHAHVSEQRAENETCVAHHGVTPIELLDKAGALTDRFTAVHATHCTERDVALLGEATACVCMCPTTERDLGDGIGPTNEFVAAGIAIALGSDSHATIDPFEEARALELDERLRSEQRGIHGAADLLVMAAEHGHRCLGWHDAGSLRVGARADLVTIDLGSVRTAGTIPAFAAQAAVFSASAADVVSVIVDGRTIVAEGHHHMLDVAAELHHSILDLFGD